MREYLAHLLEAALEAGLEGWAESDLIELAEIVENGLPEGHCLVLAESTVAGRHPLAKTLASRGALLEMGKVESTRGGGFKGLETLTEELSTGTGGTIDRGAVQATLQKFGPFAASESVLIAAARGGGDRQALHERIPAS